MATKLTWNAPLTAVDGTPYTQAEIDSFIYELGYRANPGEQFLPHASFPGTLNPGGKYEADFVDMPGLPTTPVEVALRTVDASEDPALKSAWSETVPLDLGSVPNPPTNLATE